MKKLISTLVATLLLSLLGCKTDPIKDAEINLQDFNLDYYKDNGIIFFKKAVYKHPIFNVNFNEDKLNLFNRNNRLGVNKDTLSFHLAEHYSKIINSLENVYLENFNLNFLYYGPVHFSGSKAFVGLAGGIHELNSVELNCQTVEGLQDFACLENARLKISKIKIDSSNQQNFTKALLSDYEMSSFFSIDELKNFNMRINAKRMYFEFKIKKIINLKIKGYTKIDYNQANKELILEVSQIKAGIFNITKKFLQMVKEAKIKNLRVQGSKLFISF